MNAAIVAALNTVEQDHELVLEKVRLLKEAVTGLCQGVDAELPAILQRLRESDDFFATRFAAHLHEEDETLFPLLEQQPDGQPLVARLRADHDRILEKREAFGNCLTIAADLDNVLPRAVLRDVISCGWDLLDMLDKHAHLETQAVRQCLARAMGEDLPTGHPE
jgi:hypothetical protein